MCGIFGYIGERDCGKIILDGLRSLEYRGYDSWGIAVKGEKGILCKRGVGKISDAEFGGTKAKIGIGHTRWATHGSVSENNSHPHHDGSKRFYVVHNGIIENHETLRKEIGERFYSQTDTEVIPKLIAKYAKLGFVGSVIKAVSMLKGNFAVAIIDKESDMIICARNGSPLVIGKSLTKTSTKENEFFISSDIPSLLPYTKDIFFMEDQEIALIGKDISFIDFSGKLIKKSIIKMTIGIERAMKGNHEHFMLKEIYEQPDVIKETMEGYFRNGSFNFDQHIGNENIRLLSKVKRIIIVACGTSWHSGLVSEYWFEAFSKIPVEVEYASEFRYRDPLIERDTLVIAISQSGETADTIAAIKEAKNKGAKIMSVCNVVGSTIDRISDIRLYTRAGPEIGVASTKAFTTQLTILLLLSLYLAKSRRTLPREEIRKKIIELGEIPQKIRSILGEEKRISKIIEKYHNKKNALFLGRGVNFPIALEGALKLKEISYIHAEGYPAAEMKHGPIALIDKDMPSIFICVKDSSYEKVVSNIEEVRARKGKVIAVVTKDDMHIRKKADEFIEIPPALGSLTPFLTVIPLQLLAYHIAKKRGCEIDKPRNLAKSVTVE